ncbi:MAG: flagellar basal-body rod protein FlgF [Calditrichaeota bacterium]|nr:MAG: flagellar basal-body rod protein FlgF [Calditrichota bacterium]
MIRGLFTSATSMMARGNVLDVVTNNLANVDTVGYKRDRVTFRNVLDAKNIVEDDPDQEGIENIETDFTAGQFKLTDNPLDFALEGDGFFVIQRGDESFYSRNGSFKLGQEGELLTLNGYQVMGEGGPIVLQEGEIVVNKDGTILSGSTIAGKFLVVDFENPDGLMKAGNNLFARADGMSEPQQIETLVKQGSLEQSNVNPLEEMVNLILISRDYTQNQKSIQTQDSTLQKAVNDLGRI